jgi:hypothetical protein
MFDAKGNHTSLTAAVFNSALQAKVIEFGHTSSSNPRLHPGNPSGFAGKSQKSGPEC